MMWNILVTVAAAYGVLCLLLFLFQSGLIYYPEIGQEIVHTPEQAGLPFEPVKLATSDGETLDAWLVPAKNPASGPARGVVLFFHGNAGNISHRMDSIMMFYRMGYGVLIFDYRGYGRSTGSPSEQGTYRDAEAAWKYLIEAKRIPASHIVLFGESLGGAVAARLAAREKPGALVLASVFTSVPDMGAKLYPFLPVRLLSRFDYNAREYLKAVSCPVFVAHSRDDDIVPFEHGRLLYDAAREPKQFLELQGGHNDGFIFMREPWVKALDAFLQTHHRP